MSVLQHNLSVLAAAHPEIDVDALRALLPAAELEIRPAASGAPTALLAGSYIHSRYDPEREAKRLAEPRTGTEVSVCLFYGFGLGYAVAACRELYPDLTLVVVEPRPEFFVRALASRDLGDLLAAEQVRWLVGRSPEEVVMAMEDLPLASARMLPLRPIVELNGDYFRSLDRLIRSFLDRRNVNVHTLARFGRLWVRNLLANLPLWIASPGITSFFGRFSGLPALVVAAGPSLDALLPHATELAERCLLVAVDTALRHLLAAGVEPDFLVTVDPQYYNTRHLDRAGPGRTVLISESAAHPRIFRTLKLGPCFASSFFPLGQFLEKEVAERGTLGAGGSVSTTAWDFARLAGGDPIYMAGLDLGFPDRQTHARGSFFEEGMHLSSGRLGPAEQAHFRYFFQADPYMRAANNGGLTYTDRRMAIYINWFENQMRQHPDTRTFNLSAAGVAVEGMPFRELDTLLALPPRRREIGRRVNESAAAGPGPEETRRIARRSGAALSNLARELERLKALAERALACCLAYQADTAGGVPPLLAELDEEMRRLASSRVAGFLLQSLIEKVLSGGSGTLEEVMETSRLLYSEIAASARYHLELIGRTLNSLKL
jgi:hypothetical protein